MRCPLCGYEFDASAMSCHSSCAFNESCGIICCPNCGYQVPDERKSYLAGIVQRYFARRRTEADLPPVRPLSSMHAGEAGKIVQIRSESHLRAERLHVLGLTADALIRVEQQHPTYVLRVGFTELSVDREIAEDILVEVEG